MTKITPEACRAARALLGWSMRDLAEKAGVSLMAVMRLESETGASRARTVERIRMCFAANDVELVLEPTHSGAILEHQLRAEADDVGT